MERYTEEIAENDVSNVRNSYQEKLETKKAELAEVKEEIKKAREIAIQSWLDSKPVIDQLDKLQLELKNAKNRGSMATMRELETQLEATHRSIRSKKKEEIKARTAIDEVGSSLELTRAEMETLKHETAKERRARAKLKQELRLRRQTLRTLQLTLRAVRIDSEALGASAADALHYIKRTTADDDDTIQLTHEDYHALIRKANEETNLAEWRVSMSMEQRYTAEASRDKALRRLKELYTGNRSRKRDVMEEDITEQRERETRNEVEKGFPKRRNRTHGNKTRISLQEIMTPTMVHGPSQQLRKAKSNQNKKSFNKKKPKKPSILHKIKSFFARNIVKFFG